MYLDAENSCMQYINARNTILFMQLIIKGFYHTLLQRISGQSANRKRQLTVHTKIVSDV